MTDFRPTMKLPTNPHFLAGACMFITACAAPGAQPHPAPSPPVPQSVPSASSSGSRDPAPTAGAAGTPSSPTTTPASEPEPGGEFPDRTVSDDPRLGDWLDPTAPLDPYFSSTSALRQAYRLAQSLLSTTKANLRSGAWKLEIRTGCLHEYDGNVEVYGRALVRDSEGRVRALTEASASGDVGDIDHFYYDASGHPRFATFNSSHYRSGVRKGAIILDESGRLTHCDEKIPSYLCSDDPAASNPRAEEFKSMDPVASFEKCNVTYEPSE